MLSFQELGLTAPLLKALQEEGYTHPTRIQELAIPHLLQGKDLLGCAQTGTGKTAAFSLPILQLLHARTGQAAGRRPIRSLILTPTRELAIQIEESLKAYGRHVPLRHLVIFGGVGQQPQVKALQQGVDVLVATPGRLLDLMDQGFVSLSGLEIFVLDEADRMLDMGFIHDVKKVISRLPARRQSLFFSATMPPDIRKLADTILTEPVQVEVTPAGVAADTVQQHIYYVSKTDKRSLLLHLLRTRPEISSVLVFTRTKHGADRVAKDLNRQGIQAMAIHGNKSQPARQLALQNFKKGQTRVLVATDIAARGIDIDDLGFVINFDLPNIPESYVHRIGRTGRAGANGEAISFCEAEERPYLRDIQKLIGRQIPVVPDHPFSANAAQVVPPPAGENSAPARTKPHPQRQPQAKPAAPKPAPAHTANRAAKPQPKHPNATGRMQPQGTPNQVRPAAAEGQVRKPRPNKELAPLPPPRKPLKQESEKSSNAGQTATSGNVPSITPLFSDDDRW